MVFLSFRLLTPNLSPQNEDQTYFRLQMEKIYAPRFSSFWPLYLSIFYFFTE